MWTGLGARREAGLPHCERPRRDARDPLLVPFARLWGRHRRDAQLHAARPRRVGAHLHLPAMVGTIHGQVGRSECRSTRSVDALHSRKRRLHPRRANAEKRAHIGLILCVGVLHVPLTAHRPCGEQRRDALARRSRQDQHFQSPARGRCAHGVRRSTSPTRRSSTLFTAPRASRAMRCRSHTVQSSRSSSARARSGSRGSFAWWIVGR